MGSHGVAGKAIEGSTYSLRWEICRELKEYVYKIGSGLRGIHRKCEAPRSSNSGGSLSHLGWNGVIGGTASRTAVAVRGESQPICSKLAGESQTLLSHLPLSPAGVSY